MRRAQGPHCPSEGAQVCFPGVWEVAQEKETPQESQIPEPKTTLSLLPPAQREV